MNENNNNKKNTHNQGYKKGRYPNKKWNGPKKDEQHSEEDKQDTANENVTPEKDENQDRPIIIIKKKKKPENEPVNKSLESGQDSQPTQQEQKTADSAAEGQNPKPKKQEQKPLPSEPAATLKEVPSDDEAIDNEDDDYEINPNIFDDMPLLKSKPRQIKEVDEEELFLKQTEQEADEELVITWHRHDCMKTGPDFHRGCCLQAENYVAGSNVLKHSQCKLDSYNWLKDFQDAPHEAGELLIAEVRFKNDRKDFFSYPAELQLIEGELVAVETAIGHDLGIVSMVGPLIEKQRERKHNALAVSDLKKIYRRARLTDVEKFIEAMKQENRTLYRSREIAVDLNLEMKLNDIEYQGDKTKAIFYYTADGRVDFRELIKKLAEEFHVRVEMRQIGFRQESAKLGGIGSCGRELCCSSWMTDFQSVTTGVARVQQLSPNPQKLAGQCGKLKCCLNYEYENYIDAMKSFPDNRIILKTKKGDAIYQKMDIFKGLMWYSYTFERGDMMAIPVDKVKEIIADNKKGVFPEQLEDFAFIKEQQNTEYGEEGKNVDLSKLE